MNKQELAIAKKIAEIEGIEVVLVDVGFCSKRVLCKYKSSS